MIYTRMNPMTPNMQAKANDIPPPSFGTLSPEVLNMILRAVNPVMYAQQNPGVSMGEDTTQLQPSPAMLGTGSARIAGNLAQLQRMAKEAALRGDFEMVDRINAQIQAMQQQQGGQ